MIQNYSQLIEIYPGDHHGVLYAKENTEEINTFTVNTMQLRAQVLFILNRNGTPCLHMRHTPLMLYKGLLDLTPENDILTYK